MSDTQNPATGGAPAGRGRLVSAYSDGGHEVDNLPATRLIMLVAGLAALIFLTGVGIYQYYNLNASADAAAAAQGASARSAVAQAARAAVAETWAETDADKGIWRMPASEGAKRVLANPALLRAAAPPEGFVSPDDVGNDGAAAPPEPAAAAPTEAAPTEAAPAEAAPEDPADAPAAEEPAALPAEGDAP